MTARRAALRDLPAWPRLLSARQAAAYLGISAGHFRAHVAASVAPIAIGTRKLWDRQALDAWVDSRGGPGAAFDDTDWVETLRGHDPHPRH